MINKLYHKNTILENKFKEFYLSGYPESDRSYMHPMHEYYHYTISRMTRPPR